VESSFRIDALLGVTFFPYGMPGFLNRESIIYFSSSPPDWILGMPGICPFVPANLIIHLSEVRVYNIM
jgi:hypothetical protein